MKIAITSTGPDLDSRVDERFGRTPYFLIVDTESEEQFESVDNSVNLNAMQGAGLQSAQLVSDRGVAWVLTGHVGPKAYQALQSAGIKVGNGAAGTCRETLKRFREGGFSPASGADVQSHW